MKKCFLYLLMVGGLGACIQSEPLNAEADITACKILNAKGLPETNIKGNIIINNAQVLAQANPKIDLTNLALQVTLTEGASISPDPSKVMDYSQTRKFTVTSQDGNWHKEYSVIIDTFDLPFQYDFEHYELNETGKYQVFFEETQGTALFKHLGFRKFRVCLDRCRPESAGIPYGFYREWNRWKQSHQVGDKEHRAVR